jgi:hypothetical protein
VIPDGKIIPCERCIEPAISVKGEPIDLWYSGEAHIHGGNMQAVLAPGGFPGIRRAIMVQPSGGPIQVRSARLTTMASWVVRAMTTIASPSGSGFSSRCGTHGGT